MNLSSFLSDADSLALLCFFGLWASFAWVADYSPWRKYSLSAAMDRQRAQWIETLKTRELRMIDTNIMSGLQNGTAFFASSALFAIGGAFALLNATDEAYQIMQDLPFVVQTTKAQWEMKGVGLLIIFAYAFFKFGWAYRLFNYASILVGAIPMPQTSTQEEMAHSAEVALRMNTIAGRHFNRGLRAFFFSLGYMGWFVHPYVFIAATAWVTVVLLRRQFISLSLKAAKGDVGK